MRQVRATDGLMTITQGEFVVSDNPDCVVSTILGSCVSTCLWDPIAGVGGMNHVLVARSGAGPTANDAAGVNAMELLINALVRIGADRRGLQAKVFGGAKMISGLSDIGQLNGIFTLEFLDRESIPCISKSLGGTLARQVRFHPTIGRAQLKLVSADNAQETIVEAPPQKVGNDVELF